MSIFKKGAIRKAWVEGKKAAKKACKEKYEEVFLTTFSKDDFGPKLDKVDELFPKKDAKPADYKKAWTAASETCKKLYKQVQNVGIEEMNIDTQKCLLQALDKIRESLDNKEIKPK